MEVESEVIATSLASALVELRCVACAQITTGNADGEYVLLSVKTTSSCHDIVHRAAANACLSTPLWRWTAIRGNASYLAWLDEECTYEDEDPTKQTTVE